MSQWIADPFPGGTWHLNSRPLSPVPCVGSGVMWRIVDSIGRPVLQDVPIRCTSGADRGVILSPVSRRNLAPLACPRVTDLATSSVELADSALASAVLAISGGARAGVLQASDYTSTLTPEGLTVTLQTPLADGRVVLSPAVPGFTVTRVSSTVWRAERTVTLQVVGGVDDGLQVSQEPVIPLWQSIPGSLSGFSSDTYRATWTLDGDAQRLIPTSATDATHLGEAGPGVHIGGAWSVTTLMRSTGLPLVAIMSDSARFPGAPLLLGAASRALLAVVDLDSAAISHVAPGLTASVRMVDGWCRVDLSGTATAGSIPVRIVCTNPTATQPISLAGTADWYFPGNPSLYVEVSRVAMASGVPSRWREPGTTDATLGPVQPDGSRSVTLAQDTPGLSWTDAPAGWEVAMTGLRSAELRRSISLTVDGSPATYTLGPVQTDGSREVIPARSGAVVATMSDGWSVELRSGKYWTVPPISQDDSSPVGVPALEWAPSARQAFQRVQATPGTSYIASCVLQVDGGPPTDQTLRPVLRGDAVGSTNLAVTVLAPGVYRCDWSGVRVQSIATGYFGWQRGTDSRVLRMAGWCLATAPGRLLPGGVDAPDYTRSGDQLTLYAPTDGLEAVV